MVSATSIAEGVYCFFFFFFFLVFLFFFFDSVSCLCF